MHYALPGSALVHALALGAGLLMFAWPAPDDAPAMQSVSVEVITIAPVPASQASTLDSDATETLVSSGAEASSPVTPETIDPAPPEAPELSVEPAIVEPPPPDQPKPTEAKPQPMAQAVLSALAPVAADPVVPVQPAPEPTESPDLNLAPMPHILSRSRPSAPTQRPPRQQAAPPPRTNPPAQQAQPRPSAPAGNGGHNQADAVAAKPSAGQQGNSGSGGDAEVARYPSQVVARLRRALRYPGGAGGASGEVHVQFTVSSGGRPSSLRVVKSSGNAAIDQAGLDTVMRAAPFPPIPAGANRNSWGFTVPLAFVRG